MLEETKDDFRSILVDLPESSLMVPSTKFMCPECDGEITWYCERDIQGDPRLSPPCRCTDGHCKCDHFVCVKCGLMVDKAVAGRRARMLNTSSKIIIP